jgi:hydroxymethylpyrimidine/phosphomethylpyrimidine kinase
MSQASHHDAAAQPTPRLPAVLVFSGADPSGGAGMQADIQALTACGAHPLPVLTALTVQDNDRVHAVHPVAPELILQQAQAVIDKIEIAAVKIGIVGQQANAEAIARLLVRLRDRYPDLPVVLDTVLASGQGDALAADDPYVAVRRLLPFATLATPNLPEAARLCGAHLSHADQAAMLLLQGCSNVLLKGGHANVEGAGSDITNRWYGRDYARSWQWPRLAGSFHGSGCTLASACAAFLARGVDLATALEQAQAYCHASLAAAFAIAQGQLIPQRDPAQQHPGQWSLAHLNTPFQEDA